jgi:hypothetical protein
VHNQLRVVVGVQHFEVELAARGAKAGGRVKGCAPAVD